MEISGIYRLLEAQKRLDLLSNDLEKVLSPQLLEMLETTKKLASQQSELYITEGRVLFCFAVLSAAVGVSGTVLSHIIPTVMAGGVYDNPINTLQEMYNLLHPYIQNLTPENIQNISQLGSRLISSGGDMMNALSNAEKSKVQAELQLYNQHYVPDIREKKSAAGGFKDKIAQSMAEGISTANRSFRGGQ